MQIVPTLFTQSSQAKKNSVFMFRYNLYLVISYALIPTTYKFSHPFFSVIAPNDNVTTSLTKKNTYMAYPSQSDSKLEVKH